MVNKESTRNQPSEPDALLTRARSRRTRSPQGDHGRRGAQQLAEAASDAWVEFEIALGANKRKYPLAAFRAFFAAVKEYAEATAKAPTIHKAVATHVNGLADYLAGERKRVPEKILYDAGRLECILFDGYDPDFEGDEPPGL